MVFKNVIFTVVLFWYTSPEMTANCFGPIPVRLGSYTKEPLSKLWRLIKNTKINAAF